jgi:hypothetical protein
LSSRYHSRLLRCRPVVCCASIVRQPFHRHHGSCRSAQRRASSFRDRCSACGTHARGTDVGSTESLTEVSPSQNGALGDALEKPEFVPPLPGISVALPPGTSPFFGDRGSGIGGRERGIRGRGSGIGDQGSGKRDQGSGIGRDAPTGDNSLPTPTVVIRPVSRPHLCVLASWRLVELSRHTT